MHEAECLRAEERSLLEDRFDVIVIGGGPAGSSAASELVRHGHSVLVVEKDHYPRFHIGESLLPGVLAILDELGVAEAIHAEGFVRKYAAEFVTPDAAIRQRYVFSDSLTPEHALAYQVERARFDQILLDHARRQGAEVRAGVEVTHFEEQPESIVCTLREGDAGGEPRRVSGDFLIDASGQHSFIARRLGLRQLDLGLRNVAIYAHFTGATPIQGDRAGDITVVLDPEGWWWVIPLREVTSLGFVAPKAAFRGKPDSNWMLQRMREIPVLMQRFESAELVSPARVAADYSYSSRRLVGKRWLLAGDAAAFLDPVFSTGVYLGVSSGVKAAQAVTQALTSSAPAAAVFSDYAAWLTQRVRVYGELVRGFYRPEFTDLFMHPSSALQLRQAVTSALAGFAEEPEVLRRLKTFLSAARANKDQELSPRLPGRREAAARLALASLPDE